MSRAIVTFGTGPCADMLQVALPGFKKFACLHGYELIVVEGLEPKMPPAWYKVPVLLEALKSYDEVLWLGADLVIVDSSEDIPVSKNCWQAMVIHHTGDGEVPNTEVWYNRREMIPTLEKMWGMAQNGWANAPWWEQSALMELMGYVDERRPVYLGRATDLYNHTYQLDNSWNVHKWDKPQAEHPRIQHATMYPDRLAIMREWAGLAV
jgi:hypothetical protein